MERQRATTQMAHYDDFSKALIESSVKYLGEEGIPSLQKKGNEDDFSKKDPKAKAAPADPAINIAAGTGTKQSHGAEIEYTTVRAKNVQREEVEKEDESKAEEDKEKKMSKSAKEKHEKAEDKKEKAMKETIEIEIDGEIYIAEKKNKEGKEQGVDGKACWKGYKYAGTEGGKDKCVKEEKKEKEGADKKSENKFHTKLDKLVHKTFGASSDEKKMKKEEVSLQDIVEKAVSKSQQRFMGMVHAKKKGEMKDGSEKVDKAAASLTGKEAEKFASTKHKGLPEKKTKKEDYDVDTANQLWSEVGEKLEKLGEMDGAKFKVIGEKMDPVGKEDSDVNNDGKTDKQDKFLKGRRSKVSKIIAAKKKVAEMLELQQEIINEKKQ